MDLHGKIMNLPHSFDLYALGRHEKVSYLVGFKDARHAAAELALQADKEIADLKLEIARLQAQLDART